MSSEYCCLHRHPAPCATFGSPHTAARSILIHGPLPLYGLQFKLLTLRHSAMGPCTASSCCCQVQSVSWVPVRPPIAADFIARLCHVPLSGLLTLLVGSIL
ncbi:unnamed protein product [Staurois parvus]|uniref:Uncharacterized protein n=2 Tax=Staurois parvus TaxID=386267 RepID=A0ABN9AQW5_9NEOB|nr:unnamed protein product [Staurois parvus]